MSAALPYHDSTDQRATTRARLSFPPINIMQILEGAPVTGAIDVIGNRRSAMLDGESKHLDQLRVDSVRT